MKKAVMLPLVAAISGAMIGCGGGGGGGSSTPPPAVKSYTFQFIQMEVNKDPSAISCPNTSSPTIFKYYDNGNIDFAKVAAGAIDIHTYNADGSFNKNLSGSLGSDGKLTLTVNDVEDGGYVTIIDNLGSSSSPILHTLSIQKELLSNLLINVESLQGNQASCYVSNKMVNNELEKKVSLGSQDPSISIDEYSYETYVEGYNSSTATIKADIPATSNSEQVLFTGLSSGEVVAATLVKASDLTDNSSSTPGTVELNTLDNTSDLVWDISTSQTINDAYALAYTSSTSFKWQELSQSSSSIKTLGEMNFSVLLDGSEAGWNVVSNTRLNSNLVSTDIKLTEATISSGITPQVNSCSSGCVVDTANAVSSNLNGFQRSYFEVAADSKHTIYASIPDNSETVIPDYNIDSSYKPTDGLLPEISFFYTKDSVNDDFVQFAMTKYNSPGSTDTFVDKVSVVALPSESLLDKQKNASLQYEVVEK
ncbi:hypothetical protein [Vibrio maritimus]|uniref:hypothetical protein n=1 Tax=Vibrio maritimus TaxID=990268 RepID=UPI0037368BC0